MKLSIYLGCSILLFLSPLCLGYTSQEDQLHLEKVSELMSNSQSFRSKMINTQQLVFIYRHVKSYIPAYQRQRLDRLVAENTTPLGESRIIKRRDRFTIDVVSDEERKKTIAFWDELAGAVKNCLVKKVEGN